MWQKSEGTIESEWKYSLMQLAMEKRKVEYAARRLVHLIDLGPMELGWRVLDACKTRSLKLEEAHAVP
jgi:hypothetical protein